LHQELASTFIDHVREHAVALAPLVRAKSTARAPRMERWKLAVNVSVEPDR